MKSKGVTERNLQLRLAMTMSSILWTVFGSKTYLGSKTWSSKRSGTWGSSIFAAKDKHATDSSWNGHPFGCCKWVNNQKKKRIVLKKSKFSRKTNRRNDNWVSILPEENERKETGRSSWRRGRPLPDWNGNRHEPSRSSWWNLVEK